MSGVSAATPLTTPAAAVGVLNRNNDFAAIFKGTAQTTRAVSCRFAETCRAAKGKSMRQFHLEISRKNRWRFSKTPPTRNANKVEIPTGFRNE